MLHKDGRWSVIGVVSYGDDCLHLRRPGVYTKVQAYLSWIRLELNTIQNKRDDDVEHDVRTL